jgi:hypothetical protein
MRNYAPSDKYDNEEAERLGAEPWQLELLAINPSYCSWGPLEDYMITKEGQRGWDASIITPTWKEFSWSLDDLNECVNFYFHIERASRPCEACDGIGYHTDAQWITESFHGHSTPFRSRTGRELEAKSVLTGIGVTYRNTSLFGFPSEETLAKYGPKFRSFCEEMRDGDGQWGDKITEDEAKALVKEGRGSFGKLKTASDFNQAQRGRGIGHDCINRSILIEQRCKRLGVPKTCPSCDGHAEEFTEAKPHVSLTLWMLHPRKGCSRGIEVSRIERSEIPAALEWLKKAAQRNADRFSGILR